MLQNLRLPPLKAVAFDFQKNLDKTGKAMVKCQYMNIALTMREEET